MNQLDIFVLPGVPGNMMTGFHIQNNQSRRRDWLCGVNSCYYNMNNNNCTHIERGMQLNVHALTAVIWNNENIKHLGQEKYAEILHTS